MNRVYFSIGIIFVFAISVTIAINLLIELKAVPYLYVGAAEAPSAAVALVPGAALSAKGELSPIFTDRVDMAIAVYGAGKVSKILVSGDNSTVSHNEVDPARLYLLAKGIPDEDIFLDHAGFDTYSSMYRARHIFGVSSALITSQSFHLPRAVFIARELGIAAYGVNADTGDILPRNYGREVFANVKAVLDVVLHRKPKYLGEPIPITGDGRLYP